MVEGLVAGVATRSSRLVRRELLESLPCENLISGKCCIQKETVKSLSITVGNGKLKKSMLTLGAQDLNPKTASSD